MRRRYAILISTLMILFVLSHSGAATSQTPLPPGRVEIPAELMRWLETAKDTSYDARTLQRERAVAESQFRMKIEKINGYTAHFESAMEANEKGVAIGPTLAFQLHRGVTSLRAGLGAIPMYQWEDERLHIVPSAFLSLRHELGRQSDVDLKRIQYEYDEAKYKYNTAEHEWVLRVIQGYADWHIALLDLQLAEQHLELVEARYAHMLNRIQKGAITQNDLYAAESEVTQAEESVSHAEHRLAKERLAFQDVLGLHVEPLFSEGDTLVIDITGLPETDDTTDWVAYARAHRADFQLAEKHAVLTVEELVHAEKQLGFTGEIVGDVTVPASSSDNAASVGWRVGAVFDLPLYNRTKEEDVVQAQLQAEQAKEDIEYREQKLYDEILMAWWAVQLAEENYERHMRALNRARQIEKAMQRAWDEGVGSSLDVQASALRSAEAERSVLRAQYDKLIEQVSFLHVLGRDLLQ